jgi:HPt (histidine-containing phosphotransfer) domain-containing protein
MSESKQDWLVRIADLHGLDPEDIDEIGELCLEDTAGNIAAVKTAPTESDLSTAVRAAHSIKGSAANIGLTNLSDAAKTIEAQLLQNDFNNFNENLEILNSAMTEFKNLMG